MVPNGRNRPYGDLVVAKMNEDRITENSATTMCDILG